LARGEREVDRFPPPKPLKSPESKSVKLRHSFRSFPTLLTSDSSIPLLLSPSFSTSCGLMQLWLRPSSHQPSLLAPRVRRKSLLPSHPLPSRSLHSPCVGYDMSKSNSQANLDSHSPPPSKLLFLNSLQMTGSRDGHHHMPRRKTRRLKRIGRMLENGRLKSQQYCLAWSVTKVSSSRIQLRIMLSLPNFPRR
jgi:hypothetical protein